MRGGEWMRRSRERIPWDRWLGWRERGDGWGGSLYCVFGDKGLGAIAYISFG